MEDARNVFQTRAAIEGYCASYMACRAGEEETRYSLDLIRARIQRCHEYFNHDDEMFIHEEIIRFCGNPLFEMQFRQLLTRINIFWWDVIQRENRREEVYREHSAIIQRISEGDGPGAYQASLDHNRITFLRLSECYPQKPSEDR